MAVDGNDEELEWRDTYFVLFSCAKRPTLTQVEAAIADSTGRVTLENLEANEDGLFESVLVQVPQDNAALEISFESGEAVIEQSAELAKQLQGEVDTDQLALLLKADARFDVMHFERVNADPYADDDEAIVESLDPASLLTIVEALAALTDGLPVDPASGALMN